MRRGFERISTSTSPKFHPPDTLIEPWRPSSPPPSPLLPRFPVGLICQFNSGRNLTPRPPLESCQEEGKTIEPNHQRWYAKCKLSWNICTLHTRFRTFGADLYAQSVITNKIPVLKLSREFIKSALLVGYLIVSTAFSPRHLELLFLCFSIFNSQCFLVMVFFSLQQKKKSRNGNSNEAKKLKNL